VFVRWFTGRDGFGQARELQQKPVDGSVAIGAATAARLERAAGLAARKNLGVSDALFVQLAGEVDLPLLTTGLRLGRAAKGPVRIEVLEGIGKTDR
jgi:hypothetical protein